MRGLSNGQYIWLCVWYSAFMSGIGAFLEDYSCKWLWIVSIIGLIIFIMSVVSFGEENEQMHTEIWGMDDDTPKAFSLLLWVFGFFLMWLPFAVVVVIVLSIIAGIIHALT